MTEENPVENYKKINNELLNYSKELSSRFQIVMLNKADAMMEDDIQKLKEEFLKLNENTFVVSAVTGFGVKELLNYVYKNLMKFRLLQ